jgi:hypothetical protein
MATYDTPPLLCGPNQLGTVTGCAFATVPVGTGPVESDIGTVFLRATEDDGSSNFVTLRVTVNNICKCAPQIEIPKILELS